MANLGWNLIKKTRDYKQMVTHRITNSHSCHLSLGQMLINAADGECWAKLIDSFKSFEYQGTKVVSGQDMCTA